MAADQQRWSSRHSMLAADFVTVGSALRIGGSEKCSEHRMTFKKISCSSSVLLKSMPKRIVVSMEQLVREPDGIEATHVAESERG